MSGRSNQSRRTIPLHYRIWWYLLRLAFLLWFVVCYRIRTRGRSNIPKNGAILYVSNHQSFLDPIIVGLATNRPFFGFARKTLFKHPAFAWVLRSLSAIPVDQESTGDKGAIKACIEVLKNEEDLLVFPEGSRTLDGKTQPFSPGMMLMIRRTKPTIIPVAIEGAFEVWPRDGKMRKTGRIKVNLGKPIASKELLAMETEAALASLQERVEAMRLELVDQ